MKKFLKVYICMLATLSIVSHAQTYSLQEMAAQRMTGSGNFPSSWTEMVRASQIIVKGRFGKLLSDGPFYGYDEKDGSEIPLEQYAERRNITEEYARARSGLPMVEYEILVDEVIKADLAGTNFDKLGDKLVFRAYISAPERETQYFDPALQRIFFLYFNEDGSSVSAPHEKAILNRVNNEYVYFMYNRNSQDHEQYTDRYEGRYLRFEQENEYSFDPEQSRYENIEQILRTEVLRQQPPAN